MQHFFGSSLFWKLNQEYCTQQDLYHRALGQAHEGGTFLYTFWKQRLEEAKSLSLLISEKIQGHHCQTPKSHFCHELRLPFCNWYLFVVYTCH